MSGDFSTSSHNELWICSKEKVLQHLGTSFVDARSFHIFFADAIESIFLDYLNVRNQRIIATAIVYFKRSCFSVEWGQLEPCITACTCILLALKSEENGPVKSLSAFIREARQYFKKKDPDIWYYHTAHEAEKLMVRLEYSLLHLWSCSIVVYQPYRPLLQYCKQCCPNEPEHDKLLDASWSLVNDSLRTEISLIYSPKLIALAALFVGATACEVDVNQWFSKCDVALSDVAEVAQVLLDYFEFKQEHKYDEENVIRYLKSLR